MKIFYHVRQYQQPPWHLTIHKLKISVSISTVYADVLDSDKFDTKNTGWIGKVSPRAQ